MSTLADRARGSEKGTAMTDRVTNILLTGIGGQGVLTAAELLAATAVAEGFDVKKTEVAGMAQRGGVVTSHVRMGRKVLAPAIAPGEGDFLISFEVAEALRAAPMLRKGATIVVSDLVMKPPVVHQGLFPYPDDPVAELRRQGWAVRAIPARAIAERLGNVRLINTIMLGGLSDLLPFEGAILRSQVVDRFRVRKPALAELNAQAFDAGRDACLAGV